MIRKIAFAVTLALFALVFPGSSSGGVIKDPKGDAIGAFGVPLPPLHDIDSLILSPTLTNLDVTLTFHTTISAPSAGSPATAVVGQIAFDVDQNSATGVFAIQNLFFPAFPLSNIGVDYYVDLFDEDLTPGFVRLFDENDVFIASLAAVYTPNSVSFSILLSDLGGDDGIVDAAVIVGSSFQPTDVLNSAVPEPSSLLLASLACVGIVAMSRKRLRN